MPSPLEHLRGNAPIRFGRRKFVGGAASALALHESTTLAAPNSVQRLSPGPRNMTSALRQDTTTFNLSWAGTPIGFLGDFNAMRALGTSWFSKYFSTLVAWDADFQEIHGDLAENWDVSPDEKTWTFRLHDGIKFHDESPLQAEDVDFTLHLVLNQDFPARSSSTLSVIAGASAYTNGEEDRVSGIKVIDPLTVEITTDTPQASLLNSLAQMWILPKQALADITPADLVTSNWWKTMPIGSGPFKFVREQSDQFIELEAFPEYFRGAPKIDRIINRIYQEPGAALLALENGEIDFTYIAQDEPERVEENEDLTLLPGPSLVPNVLLFNLEDPLFQDVRVRQAFMYALDRERIVETIFRGNAELIHSPFSLPQYVPSDLNTYGLDVEKSRSLLEEANWNPDDAGDIELLVWYNDQLSQDIYVTLQQQFAEAGIRIVPRMVDNAAFNQAQLEGNFQMTYYGSGNGPDPDQVRAQFDSDSFPPTGFNHSRYSNQEVDALLLEGSQTLDSEKRPEIYQKVARILNEDLPGVWLWESTRFGAVNKRVRDFVYTPAPVFARYDDHSEQWSLD